jgi:hypothetical protein
MPYRMEVLGDLRREMRFVRRTNFLAVRAELSQFTTRYEQLTDREHDRCLRLAYKAGQYGPAIEQANDSFFTLDAQEALASGLPDAQIAANYAALPWAEQAEILARYGWLKDQRHAIANGVTFSRPYTCTVSARNVPGRTIDREYFTLIRYLHGLALQTGERLLWTRKGETPDFVLRNASSGTLVGAEMGEAPLSQAWADERDAETQVIAALEPHLSQYGYSVTIYDAQSWRSWRSRIGEVTSALLKALSEIRETAQRVVCPELGIDWELRPARGETVVWTSSRRGQTAADDDQAVVDMAAAVVAAVSAKLVKNGRPRKKPSLRPCDLVLYPNGSDWSDPREVLRVAAAQVGSTFQTHFERIWMCSESFFGRLA